MKISLEDAESWYRGDEDQNVSAHQVAVFYRSEFVNLKEKYSDYDEVSKANGSLAKLVDDIKTDRDCQVDALSESLVDMMKDRDRWHSQQIIFSETLYKVERQYDELRIQLMMGTPVYHNWHEEGVGMIIPTGHGFVLYEVPQYGGEPSFSGHYKTLDEAKKEADKWT